MIGPAGITRRRFVRDAGIATIAAVDLSRAPRAAARRLSRLGKPTVAVFGGGIAGLTTAHELVERGFDVTVYERRAWGGKARSMEVPGTGVGGRRNLPSEHSPRIFFGFYRNLPDTMRRVPFSSNPRGVFDNLVAAPMGGFVRIGEPMLSLPLGNLDPTAYTSPAQIRDTLLAAALKTNIPPQGAAHFADRIVVYLSSCDARRRGQWEYTPWAQFIAEDRYGEDYHSLLSRTFSHLLWATTAKQASVNILGKTFEWLIYNYLGRDSNGPPLRIFDLPTTEAFIGPWLSELRRLGVHLRNHHALKHFVVRDGRIAGARVRGPRGVGVVSADFYVCALPVALARERWTPEILALDPALAKMRNLIVGWGNGMKFYLRRHHPIVKGHVIYRDAPWVMGSISQAQFWAGDFATRYGDGTVHDCLAVVWVDWDAPGVLYGKPARKCTPDELAAEVWEQMKRHLATTESPLTDDLLHSWHIDPGLIPKSDGFHNEDLVTLLTVGAWDSRPQAGSAIPNLVLAGDYVRNGGWEMGHMEAANVSGRIAANEIIDRAGSQQAHVEVIQPYRPSEWEPLKRIDAERYKRGLANVFDADLGAAAISDLLHARR
jgi:uncharacterized protein with NAD-binding domain and iron-sulfur cluster